MLDHAFRETERVGAEMVSDGLKTFSGDDEESSHAGQNLFDHSCSRRQF